MENLVCYAYREGRNWYVVYGDTESFFGPDEKCFSTKAEAERFMAEYRKEKMGE